MKYSYVKNEEIILKLDRDAIKNIRWCILLAIENADADLENFCTEDIEELCKLSNFLHEI